MTEFKDVLDEMPEYDVDDPWHWYHDNYNKIRRALRIAHQLMQEPSDNMADKGMGFYTRDNGKKEYPEFFFDIFKAMRDQMLRELDGE